MNTSQLAPVAADDSPRAGPAVLARTTVVAFALAGVLFALYPMIRPFSDEGTPEGAAAFASSSWVIAHTLAMAAFALLGAGLLGLHLRLRTTSASRSSLTGVVLGWIGVQLTLPFYGAETFALRAIGQESLTQGDAALLTITDSVRLGPGLAFIVVGLLLLAFGGILFAIAIWRSETLPRWSGVPLAAGLLLYLPQFETPEPVRIAHGVLVMLGCLLLARALAAPAEAAQGFTHVGAS